MADHPLLGARLKLHRASEHIEQFKLALHRFRKKNSDAVRAYRDRRGRDYVLYPFGAETVWPDLSCSAGDALHNLRSALDHVAFAVAWDRRRKAGLSKQDLQGVYFSVRPNRLAFKTRRTKRVEERIGTDWVRFLRGVQPYQRRGSRNLWRIAALDNMDKHRSLLRLTPFAEVSIYREGADKEFLILPVKKGVIRIPGELNTIGAMVVPYVTFADVPVRKTLAGIPLRKIARAQYELHGFHTAVADLIGAAEAQFFSDGLRR